jgi:hypothetical protein
MLVTEAIEDLVHTGPLSGSFFGHSHVLPG